MSNYSFNTTDTKTIFSFLFLFLNFSKMLTYSFQITKYEACVENPLQFIQVQILLSASKLSLCVRNVVSSLLLFKQTFKLES